ncbi:MAG: zraS 2 [Acidobacteria bacterium]|nr:zraS 2 [Acidobacteriota bacterium]
MTRPSDRRFRRLAVFALLLLTGALGVLGAHAFRRKIEVFQPLGFEAVAAGDHWQVRRVSSPPPGGLAAGDRIVLVNGTEAAAINDLRRILARRTEAQLVVLRGDQLETLTYRRPPLDVDLPWVVLAAVSIGYLAIGLFTLWRTREGELFYLWCLTSATFFGFSPVFPVDRTGAAIFLADELARLFLPPLTLHLFLSIPRPGADVRRRWLPFVYLPAAALSALQIDLALFGGRFLAGPASPSSLALLDRLELVQLGLFASAAIAVLAVRLRRVEDWEQRRQLLWLLVGMVGGYAPFFALYGLPWLAGLRLPEGVAALAVLPLACVPLAFAWAILRYRLWDLGLIVRNGASYALTILFGVGSFSLLDVALGRAVPEGLGFARDLLTFFGGLAIAGLAIPAHRGIHGALERLAYGRAFGRRRGLTWLGQELLQERDLDRLSMALLSELEHGLDLERANLLLAQGSSLLPVRPEAEIPDPIPLTSLSGRVWDGSFETLSAFDLPGERVNAEQRLYASGYRYVFPLRVRNSRLGLVVATLRHDGQPLNSADVELVRALLDQAALAIENAQLLDQVQRQLERVVSLQRHNEGILESSPAGIALIDADANVVTANLAFANLAGRPRASLTGRPISEAFPLRALPVPGEGPSRLSFRDVGGRERVVEANLAPLQDGEHEGQRVLVLQDVTERVAMEGALKEKDRLAALGVLAAGVAHEVNTPLTGISSYAQLLLAETEPGDPRRSLLEKVEKQTFRASRIVSNLLEFARKPGRERERLDLVAILGETAELLRERMSARAVRLQWDPPSEPVEIVGSPGELQQVFTNLMLNAIDAMAAQGGGTLTLRLERAEGRVSVLVDDSGPGVPAERLQTIFEPFYTTKRGEGGTGLGLSISANIVEQHGGSILVENRAPGCRFTVTLPVESPPSVAPE